MQTKICTQCGKELPIEDFYWRNKVAGTRRSECKSCHKKAMKIMYQQKKKEVLEIKSNYVCKKCGYNKCLEALEFHHIDPKEKDFSIAEMLYHHKDISEITNEIQKCVVLCANCHREFHYLNKINNINIDEFLLNE